MSPRPLTLITGSTGLLGKGMEETAPAGARLLGLHQRDYAVKDSRMKHLVLDIRDKRAVDRLFAKHKFDAVVHAAGIASVDYVEKHYAESLESNIVGTLNITAACRKAGIHLVYVSTNAVFDGKKPPYREDGAVNPVNKYGRLKADCEKIVADTLEHWTVARPILMYGWNHIATRPNPATWIYDKLMRGERVQLVNDVVENPLFNLQCGRALWAIIRRKPAGVFHLGGKNASSRLEFGRRIAKAFGLDASLIDEVGSDHFPGIAPRPPNTTFVVKRMEDELGVAAMTLDEGLRAMKESLVLRP
ncbi:MAG: SDR family oxidoreductase [Elusimicrobia bacterium]|nr:SDR family oxidoreductase [Elusimicrobiota bacterium]